MVLRKIFIIFLILLCVDLLAESLTAVPRLEAKDFAVRLYHAKEPLAVNELAGASLLISGVEDNRLDYFRQKFAAKIEEVKSYFKGRGVSTALADDLLQYMHKKYLKQYNVKQTKMDVLLDNGTFNCVSSAVFYLVLSRSLGFTVYGVKTTDHSLISLTINDVSYDVETTSVFGFNPGEKREFKDDFGKTTGYAYVPPGHYSERQRIGEKELLFLILYNRVVLLLEEKQYSQAVSLAADGYELLQDDFALTLLLQTFSQYSTWAVSAKQFAAGLDTLKKAITIYKQVEKLKELQNYLILQWTLEKIEQGDFQGAEVFITAEYKAKNVKKENYEELMLYLYQNKAEHSAKLNGYKAALEVVREAMAIFDGDERLFKLKIRYTYNYIIELVNKGNYDEASSVLIHSQGEKIFSDKDSTELFAYLYQKKAEQVFASQGIWATLDMLEQGMNNLQDKSLVIQIGEMYVFNYIKELINKGKFNEAMATLDGNYAQKFLKAKSAKDLLLFYYLTKAEALAGEFGYLKGAECIEEGMAKLGRQSLLLNNYEAYIHNYVVMLAEAKEYKKALEVLGKALSVLPESSLFKKDKKAIEENMN
jgi:hypothetical protein